MNFNYQAPAISMFNLGFSKLAIPPGMLSPSLSPVMAGVLAHGDGFLEKNHLIPEKSPLYAWHFLQGGRYCANGDLPPAKAGQIVRVDPPIRLCFNGLHASLRPGDAFRYGAPGTIVQRVALWGSADFGEDKLAAEYRKSLWIRDARTALHDWAFAQAEIIFSMTPGLDDQGLTYFRQLRDYPPRTRIEAQERIDMMDRRLYCVPETAPLDGPRWISIGELLQALTFAAITRKPIYQYKLADAIKIGMAHRAKMRADSGLEPIPETTWEAANADLEERLRDLAPASKSYL